MNSNYTRKLKTKKNKVYIVLVNYKNWHDTIECLESLFKLDYPIYQVIIVDNNSQNNSLFYISEFLKGNLNVWVHPHNPLRKLIIPPKKKHLKYIITNEKDILSEKFISQNIDTKIILIQSYENKGFAYGNNIALRYILKKDDFEYVWILNNDTVVDKYALRELVLKAEEDKNIGIVSSTVMEYSFPKKVQSVGGLYNPILGYIKYPKSCKDINNKAFSIYYPYGASMLVRKSFLEEIGLMEEDYFIYFEEIDWVVRGRKRGWKFSCSDKSIVYHKGGASTGTSKEISKRSDISEFYNIRNRILFTKKYYKIYLPFVYLSMIGVIFNRLRRKEFNKLITVLKAIFSN